MARPEVGPGERDGREIEAGKNVARVRVGGEKRREGQSDMGQRGIKDMLLG